MLLHSQNILPSLPENEGEKSYRGGVVEVYIHNIEVASLMESMQALRTAVYARTGSGSDHPRSCLRRTGTSVLVNPAYIQPEVVFDLKPAAI